MELQAVSVHFIEKKGGRVVIAFRAIERNGCLFAYRTACLFVETL